MYIVLGMVFLLFPFLKTSFIIDQVERRVVVARDDLDKDDMEEGELSDEPEEERREMPDRVVHGPLPDLLREIGGAEFGVLDEKTTEKLENRAKRFNLDSHISFAEVRTVNVF